MTNSMMRHLTTDDDVIEMEMSRQGTNKIIILVEGKSDRLFFSKRFKPVSVEVHDMNGRDRVIKDIKAFNKLGKKNYLAIVDRDFWGIAESFPCIDNLIYSEQFLNLEHMLLMSESFEDVLINKGHRDKYIQYSVDDIRRDIIRESNKIFKYRLLNDIRQVYNLRFSAIDIFNSFDIESCQIDEDSYINQLVIATRNRRLTLELLKEESEALEREFKLDGLFQGHDATRVFSLFLRKKLGFIDIEAQVIEEELIKTYEWLYFFETDLYDKIVNWEKSNNVIILRRRK